MSTGLKWKQMAGALLLAATFLCSASSADTTTHTNTARNNKKKTQKPPLPPLPSGPTGPVQQVPLDSIAAMPPQVSYENNQLTIVAPNSTLADILRAVRKQTGAEIEVPSAPERVVTHLGPGPAREVMAELLNGSRFNYVLLGSVADDSVLTRVVLVSKKQETPVPAPGAEPAPGVPQPGVAANQPQEEQAEQNDAEAEENADENAEPAAAESQPAQDQQQQTPQQRMQEMQQRQMQLQQMQQSGQPPIPGPGIPARPQPPEQ
jgi:hypothetical protein